MREALREAVRDLGWANCFMIVEECDDSDITVASAAPQLRAMIAEGLLQSRVGADNRTEYALASAAPARASTPVAVMASPMLEDGKAVPLIHTALAYHASPPSIVMIERDKPAPMIKSTRAQFPKLSLRSIQILRLLVEKPAVPYLEIALTLHIKTTIASAQLNWLKGKGLANWNGTHKGALWSATEAGCSLLGVAPEAASQPVPVSPASVEEPAASEPAHIDAERSPSDSLLPSAELLEIGEAIVHRVIQGHSVRDELGLGARAEAVATDIEDLLGDVCDAQLDHALIKALVTANGAMQRAARRLAQG